MKCPGDLYNSGTPGEAKKRHLDKMGGMEETRTLMRAKILVVEDNAKNRQLVCDILHIKGYEIVDACDGAEGLRLARELMPDLILMDIQMPVMDGLEAIRALKADPATANIKIVALTSFAMKGDRETILAAGCDGYMSKPFDTRKLPSFVAEILEHPVGPRAPNGNNRE